MPKNELLTFKKDKDAIFAANLLYLVTHQSDDKAPLDNMSKYLGALRDTTSKFRSNDDDAEYEMINQVQKEMEAIQQLTYKYAMTRDAIKQRDIIIDTTRCIKRLQVMQETLKRHNIYIFGKNDTVNGPWGSEEYIDAYVTTMKRCQGGAQLLDSDMFDANNPQIVSDFDNAYKTPPYNVLMARNDDGKNKTFLMDDDAFEQYKNSRRAAGPQPAGPGVLIAQDRPDPSYTVDKNVITGKQELVQENIILNLVRSFEEPNNAFAKDLRAFVNDLKKFHYDAQSQGDLANETTQYIDNLLTLKRIEKTEDARGKEKYNLRLNLDNPEEPKFLDKLIDFIDNIESEISRKQHNREFNKKWFDEIFSKGDGSGFREILIGLKDFQKDPKIPDAFKRLCKPIQNKFENIVKKAETELDGDAFEKYVTMNTGKLNFASGADMVDGVAKVTAAYEWKKNNVRKEPAKQEAFDPAKVDKLAEDMKKDPIFKTYYTTNANGNQKWSEVFLSSATNKSEEWRVNNLKDNPFAKAHLGNKRNALKELQKLGQILPSPDGASTDYHRFNGKLKALGDKNIDRLPEGQLNFLLKDIWDENEKYMKGRKSERFYDISKEHFEETLDVLKIFSDVSNYGSAMAKKLVDRTNYVRTHRWHKMKSQSTVTLEGRSFEASKNRIDIATGKKKPPKANDAPTL